MSQIPAEVRDRIIAAANELYEQAGREVFPTVDTVRRAAKADMNTTSTIMRDWRRQQTAQAAPVAVTVPEAVSQANRVALVAMWQQAQELANESLRAAQTAWEVEREELDSMRYELANAFEEQAAELEHVRNDFANEAKVHQTQLQQLNTELSTVRDDLVKAVTRAERVEARTEEIERRATELRLELERAHGDVDLARKSLSDEQEAKQSLLNQLEKVREELADSRVVAQRDNEELRRKVASVKEEIKLLSKQLVDAQTAKNEMAKELLDARKETAKAREDYSMAQGQLKGHAEQLTIFEALFKRLAADEIERLRGSDSK